MNNWPSARGCILQSTPSMTYAGVAIGFQGFLPRIFSTQVICTFCLELKFKIQNLKSHTASAIIWYAAATSFQKENSQLETTFSPRKIGWFYWDFQVGQIRGIRPASKREKFARVGNWGLMVSPNPKVGPNLPPSCAPLIAMQIAVFFFNFIFKHKTHLIYPPRIFPFSFPVFRGWPRPCVD